MGFIDVMADTVEANRFNRMFYHIATVLVGLPLIYFLSVGPAVVIVVKAPKLRDQVRSIYAPMIWLHDQTRLKDTMDHYLGFWEQTARRL
jgi:hypothetical protein